MPNIVNVTIDAIASNPFRQLDKYPYVERKLEALSRSYADVGMWEGVIARHHGNMYEIAFGHHRVEAARRSGIETIPIIVRTLTDEQMLQFMGRENMEDYNADFLCMLETWEAGVSFCSRACEQDAQPLVIARILGWTTPQRARGDLPIMTHTARACNAAHALIAAGHLDRSDLTDLSVRAAQQIVERAQSRIDQLESFARNQHAPRRDIEEAKEQIAKGTKETIRQSREGQVAHRDLRGQVDVNTYRFAREAKKQSPLFAMFGKAVADSIAKMLESDTTSEKLFEIQKALGDVALDDDKQVLARIDFELGAIGDRAGIWRKRLTPTEKKVTHLITSRSGE